MSKSPGSSAQAPAGKEYRQIFRIVIASPGDVQAERDATDRVVEELNQILAADRGLHLVASRWEVEAHPGFHPQGPTGLIEGHLRIEDSDVLVGVFWQRIGTPGPDGLTGTEHEFQTAYRAWKRNGRPQIMIYFNRQPSHVHNSQEAEQLKRLVEFRESFPQEGLWWWYDGAADFERQLRGHLATVIKKVSTAPVGSRPTEPATVSESSGTPAAAKPSAGGSEPPGLTLPSGCAYLGSGAVPGGHELSRIRDGQTVLLMPAMGHASRPFLIDKAPVTNAQYAAFLNAPELRKVAGVEIAGSGLRVRVAMAADGRTLAVDAQDYWSVYKQNGVPWGLFFVGEWRPAPGSEGLPVTLVTGLGASWYAAWAHGVPPGDWERITEGDGLPVRSQWEAAALWDPVIKRARRFPWGDQYDMTRMNHKDYWTTGGERPTVVGLFPQGTSASGMIDAFGNVWEWLDAREPGGGAPLAIVGGAYTSPASTFARLPVVQEREIPSPAIGFRCGRWLD